MEAVDPVVLVSYIALFVTISVGTSLEWLLVDQKIVDWKVTPTFAVVHVAVAVVVDRLHQHHKLAVKGSTEFGQILLLVALPDNGRGRDL